MLDISVKPHSRLVHNGAAESHGVRRATAMPYPARMPSMGSAYLFALGECQGIEHRGIICIESASSSSLWRGRGRRALTA